MCMSGAELGFADNIYFSHSTKPPDWPDMDTTHHQGWKSTQGIKCLKERRVVAIEDEFSLDSTLEIQITLQQT